MATARYTRIDNNRGSGGYCSKATVIVFVALCLVGVWLLTSSSVIPVDNTDLSQDEEKGGVSSSIQNESGSNTQEKREEKDDRTPQEESTGEGGDGEKRKDDNEFKTENDEQKSEEGAAAAAGKKSFSDTSNSTSELDEGENRTNAGGNDSNSKSLDDGEKKSDSDDSEQKYDSVDGEKKSDLDGGENGSESDEIEKNSEDDSVETKTGDKKDGKIDEKIDQADGKKIKYDRENENRQGKNESINEFYHSELQSELLNETTAQNGSFSTQAMESRNEKESLQSTQTHANFSWKLCNVTAGHDFIPCLDNLDAIKHLKSTMHYEHRERHCPEKPPTCLVPLPEGYKRPVQWPESREKIWYSNVPHTKLAQIKGHQNWVKVAGEYLTFPGGGTQFTHGALHYIDLIQESLPDIAWGNRSRVVLDVGCGVASFGGYLFDRDVLTMSLAPKDEHEAQVQFALERGIPAISAVMGTVRLPFPGRVFDIVHCARCRVPWHIEGGKLLLELNRVLRPGGYFVWSATPVYRKNPEDAGIWKAMKKLTKDMCWETVMITKDSVNRVGIAIYRKPTSNVCYKKRSQNDPPLCSDSDDTNAAWNVSLQACMHKVPVDPKERGSAWPDQWSARLGSTPYWLQSSETGVYGKPAPDDFVADYEHWKNVVSKTYLNGIGFKWSSIRNVMDMRAVYGGFAAALKDLNIWVMNVVAIDSADTLPVIYERGLFGIYHDWCESFSTYPRSYDLLHADHLFSRIKKRCSLVALVAEVDRILRPEGKLIVRDDVETLSQLESMVKSMQWEVLMTFSKDSEGILCVQKSMWRPKESETLVYAIA